MFESCRPDFLLFSRGLAPHPHEPWQEFLFSKGFFLNQAAKLVKFSFSKIAK